MAIYFDKQERNPALMFMLRQLLVLLLPFFLVSCSTTTLEDLNPIDSKTLKDLNPLNSSFLKNFDPFKETEKESERGSIGFVRGFLGAVVVDEPRAALIGRDVLSSGGSVADVAVAVSLTLAVTQPSSASLGGGGVCLVYDNASNIVETLDFLPGVSQINRSNNNALSAIPGTLRGLAILHSKYGRLKWGQLVAPAENLARFGNPVSRAFANDLRKLPLSAWKNLEFRRLFSQGKGGQLIQEGDSFRQLELATILGKIRVRGAGEFYTGLLGRNFTTAVGQAGGGFTLNELRNYMPNWQPTLQFPYIKNTIFHFPVTSGPSGILAAQMIGMLVEDDNWDDASTLEKYHLMAEISSITNSYSKKWLRKDGRTSVSSSSLVSQSLAAKLVSQIQSTKKSSIINNKKIFSSLSPGTGTSFVAVDREGSAISCGLTLNNLFGTGKIAPGTGILLSSTPRFQRRGADSLAGILLINPIGNEFFFAASASGGPVSSSVLVQVTANTLMGGKKENLKQAVASPRIFLQKENDVTFYEESLNSNLIEHLSKRGHQLSSEKSLGQVNAIFCSNGLPNKDGAFCSKNSDPRGFGLSSGSEQ